MTWSAFVLEYGGRARADHLASILDVSVADVERLRRTRACRRRRQRLGFADLFTLRHGRAPEESDWPRPRRVNARAAYEWQAPEILLLSSLVGQAGTAEIADLLTTRLQRITGDPTAQRSRFAVRVAINRAGLQMTDVLGGVTIAAAAREIGCSSILYNDVQHGRLPATKVGRLLVIPHAAFARWKAARVFAPKGFVRLAPLKHRLGIKSDKLSEWARAGHIPTAVRCNPYGTRERSTQFGTWFIDAKVARKLLADRRAGRPMPWHGRADRGNLTVTWTLYDRRRHPDTCVHCRNIWGRAGAPRTFDDYLHRYPPLSRGAKRHLTRPYSPGLTVDEVAAHCGVPASRVLSAIRCGVLPSSRVGRARYVSRTEATRWKYRRCSSGRDNGHSWMSVSSACRQYGFTPRELAQHIGARAVRSKVQDVGPQRGHTMVLKVEVTRLRERLGYTEREAARKAGVSIARLRVLLRGLEWRPAPQIPLQVIQNIIKRKVSRSGLTIAEAAKQLKRSTAWVEQEIRYGTMRVLRTKWNARRRYVSGPMFARLRAAAARPVTRQRWTSEWMLVSDAARLAGVSPTTICRWATDGDLATKRKGRFLRYHRRSVVSRARSYWTAGYGAHVTRADRRPAWLNAGRRAA